MKRRAAFTVWLALLIAPVCAAAPTPAEVEAQKCEERIAGVWRDVLGKYDVALAELLAGFQKAADLEGALATRAEKQRLGKDAALSEQNLVTEPKALRALQTQTMTRMQELTTLLVNETLPKLIDYKKSLTVAGKLDEARSVRETIEKLQGGYLPVTRANAGSMVPAEAILSAYAADRGRADKIYKGQRIVVRGVVSGFRPDPADAKLYVVYVGGSGSGLIACEFATGDFLIREDKQFNTTILVITGKGKDPPVLRLQKGAAAEIRGTCDGMDEMVRLVKCDAGG